MGHCDVTNCFLIKLQLISTTFFKHKLYFIFSSTTVFLDNTMISS